MTPRVLRFQELINGREYRIEVAAVGAHRWRAQVLTAYGGPTALMPFYGTTPELAASELAAYLARVNRAAPTHAS